MRKLVTGILVGLLVAGSAMAAQFDTAKIGYGAKGGFAFASFDSYNGEGSSKPGINLAGQAFYPINEKIEVAAEIGFATFFIGDEEMNFGTTKQSYSTSLSDISLEGNAHYTINDQFYGIAGLGFHKYSMEFEVESEYVDSYSGQVVKTSYTADAGETKIGINFGAGYKINEKMNAELVYGLISDIAQMRLTVSYRIK